MGTESAEESHASGPPESFGHLSAPLLLGGTPGLGLECCSGLLSTPTPQHLLCCQRAGGGAGGEWSTPSLVCERQRVFTLRQAPTQARQSQCCRPPSGLRVCACVYARVQHVCVHCEGLVDGACKNQLVLPVPRPDPAPCWGRRAGVSEPSSQQGRRECGVLAKITRDL